jgi:hypothetical protein
VQSLKEMCEKIQILPKLPTDYMKAEKSINGLIDSCIADLEQLRVRHKEHIDKHVSNHRKCEQLRQKLVKEESLNTTEATGDAVAKMLKEIEEGSSLGNPYSLLSADVEQRIAEIGQYMADIRVDIEALWAKSSIETAGTPSTTVGFKGRTITVSDLTAISLSVTTVYFIGCRS